MNQSIQSKIKDKIQEDISPTRNLSGIHLKIVFGIAILWTFFQLWYASPFPFWFNFGMFKGLPARAIHLGFALTLGLAFAFGLGAGESARGRLTEKISFFPSSAG